MEHADHLFVSKASPSDRTFAIGRLPSGQLVVDDVDHGERLGPLIGDLAPFYVEIEGTPNVIFAGTVLEHDGPIHGVDLELPDPMFCRAANGAWISFPQPFESGMRVKATWRDESGRELRTYTTPPLQRRDLEPHPDAGWVGYAPDVDFG